jgi:hypothetical protein
MVGNRVLRGGGGTLAGKLDLDSKSKAGGKTEGAVAGESEFGGEMDELSETGEESDKVDGNQAINRVECEGAEGFIGVSTVKKGSELDIQDLTVGSQGNNRLVNDTDTEVDSGACGGKDISEKESNGKKKKRNQKISDPVNGDMLVECCNDECNSKGKGWRVARELGLEGESFKKIKDLHVMSQMCTHMKLRESQLKVDDLEQRVKGLEMLVKELVETKRDENRMVDELKNHTGREEKNRNAMLMEADTLNQPRMGLGAWQQGRPSLPGERSMGNNGQMGINKRVERENSEMVNGKANNVSVGLNIGVTNRAGSERENEEAGQWNVVNRGRKKRAPIVLVGDSMLTHIRNVVKCEEEESGCLSLRGAGIKQVMQQAYRKAEEMGEGMIIVQGGGNGLGHLGVRENVRVIVEGVKKIKQLNQKAKIAVMGVLPRPRESAEYEGIRGEVNRWVGDELTDMRARQISEGDNNPVTFFDPSHLLMNRHYARDGVHLNREGVNIVGRRVLGWVTVCTRR